MGNVTGHERPLSESVEVGTVDLFGSKYIVPPGKPMRLLLHQKVSASMGTYSITNLATGQHQFMCKGKATSIQDKRVITDVDNNIVFRMKEPVADFDDKQEILSPDGRRLCVVHSSGSNSKQWCTLMNRDGHQVNIVSKIDGGAGKGAIYLGSAPSTKDKSARVGPMICKLTDPKLLGDLVPKNKQRLGDLVLEIAPGVDSAFIVAYALAFEEMCDTGTDWD